LALAGTIATPNLVLAQGGDTIADTSHGKVRGRVEDGLLVFRGIPYGGDTSGRNRFMPPTPVATWVGVRDCADWGHIAPKPISNAPPSDYGRMVGWSNYRGGLSEDCLNLNIWTPALRDDRKRAVMVTIHGGGYTTGSGNLVALEGARAARAGDVVVVTVNHRLGALGYTDLSALGGDAFASSRRSRHNGSGAVTAMGARQHCQFRWRPQQCYDIRAVWRWWQMLNSHGDAICQGTVPPLRYSSGSTLRLPHHDVGQRNAEALLTKLGLAKNNVAGFAGVAVRTSHSCARRWRPDCRWTGGAARSFRSRRTISFCFRADDHRHLLRRFRPQYDRLGH